VPHCTRRTYGTGDPDDDDVLPPYTETDEDGATIVHHGTGEIDVETTAEPAAGKPCAAPGLFEGNSGQCRVPSDLPTPTPQPCP
jgi:hypothetical protein